MTLTTQDLQQQYIAYFGRPADPEGIDYWQGGENDITDPLEFALKISAQTEYADGIGQLPVANQINQLYVNLFGRNADQEGLEYWSAKIESGESVLGNLAYELIFSANTDPNGEQGIADAAALSNKTQAAQLFTDIVRTDANFLDNYDNELAFAQARAVLPNFTATTEFSVEAFTGYISGQVQTAAIAGLNFVEAPEPLTAEEQAAADALAEEQAAAAAEAQAAAVEAQAAAQAAQLQAAQLQAAQAQIAAANAQLALAQQEAAATATAELEAAEAAEAAANAPTTYKFTKTTDELIGGTGDDKFTGVIQDGTAAGTTLFPGDSADGGDGIDTLSVSIAGTTDGANAPADYVLNAITTDGIEKFFVSNFETTASHVDNFIAANLMTGLTTVGLSSSGEHGDTEFTLLKNFVDAEMRNGAGDLTLTYDNPLRLTTATDDVQNLTVSATSQGTFKADGFETININSELSKSTLTKLDSDSLTTLNLTGDTELVIEAIEQVKNTDAGTDIDATIDGSTATGKLNITLPTAGDGTKNSTFDIKGGTGDDTFDFAGNLDKNDLVDGGDGSDTIAVTASNTAIDEEFKNVTNFEKLATNATSADQQIDVSKLPAGFTDITIDMADRADEGTDTLSPAGSGITATIKNHVDQTITVKKTVLDTSDGSLDGDGVQLVINESDDTADNTVAIVLDAIDTGDAATGGGVIGGGLDSITATNYETLSIETKANKTGTMTENEVGDLTLSSAKTITITGNTDLFLGTVTGAKVKTFDASALDGKLSFTAGAASATYKFPNKQTIVGFGSGLANLDTIEGGTHAKDEINGTASGKTATTGKFNISGIETINLDTSAGGADNTFDLSNVTGATNFNVQGNTQTIIGVDLASDLRIGDSGNAVLKITGADATGDSDVLKIGRLINTNGAATNTVEADDIETLDIEVADTDTTAHDTVDFTLTKFKGTSIVAAEHKDSIKNPNVDLNTLYKTVTSVDTSGLKGTQKVSATDATSAVTFNFSGKGAVDATGSEWADSFTITESASSVDHKIAGGVGTDTATINLKNTDGTGDATGDYDIGEIVVEKLTLNVKAGDDIEFTNDAFSTILTELTLTGGNSLSSFDLEKNGNAFLTQLEKFDASGFDGSVDLAVGEDLFDDTLTVIGAGAAADIITSTYGSTTSFDPKVSSLKTLEIYGTDAANSAITPTLDLSNTSDVTTVKVAVGTNDTLNITKADGQTIKLTEGQSGSTLNVSLANDSGSEDTLTFQLDPTAHNALADWTETDATLVIGQGTDIKLQTSDVETVTIKGDTVEPATIDLSLISMDATSATTALKFTTGKTAITVSATHEDINSIDASDMGEGGSLVMSNGSNAGARSRTDSVTYTGSDGSDTLIMGNKGDVLDAGTQPTGANGDTLVVAGTLVLGGIEVDLSKTDDQITTWNGTANTAIQKGFESVDLSNIVDNDEGSVITANKIGSTITGLNGGADYVTGGDGDDVFYVTDASDDVDLKKGDNTIWHKPGAANVGNFGSTGGGTTYMLGGAATGVSFQNAGLDTGTNVITVHTADSNVTGAAGLGGVANTVLTGISAINLPADGLDLSGAAEQFTGLTNTVTGFTTSGSAVEKLKLTFQGAGTFTGTNYTLTNSGLDIIGKDAVDNVVTMPAGGTNSFDMGTGADSVTLGTGIDTILVGGATDGYAFTYANTGGDAANAMEAGDTLTFAAGDFDVVNGFTTGTDFIQFGAGQASGAAPTTMLEIATNANLTAGTNYMIYGTWAAPVFTVHGSVQHANNAPDGLVGLGTAGNPGVQQDWVVLEDISATLTDAALIDA